MTWDKTRGIQKKEDSASPTVFLEAIIITYSKDVNEITEVATIYIQRAYIQT